jgi:hypothetical protein
LHLGETLKSEVKPKQNSPIHPKRKERGIKNAGIFYLETKRENRKQKKLCYFYTYCRGETGSQKAKKTFFSHRSIKKKIIFSLPEAKHAKWISFRSASKR